MRLGGSFDIAIVGAGPAGLSAAARAAMHDSAANRSTPSHVLLEAFDHPSKTIYRYQKGKFVMAEPGYLGLRSDMAFEAGKREEILGAWDQGLRDLRVNIQLSSEVRNISGQRGAFRIEMTDGSSIEARNVVLAIGLQGNPRRLGAPGETASTVQYQLDDPDEYRDETILVVGAGDAAVENAVALARNNRVIILNRKGEFSRIKDGNQSLILKAISDLGTPLECYYNTAVERIGPRVQDGRLEVTLKTPEGLQPVRVDRIVARLGADPPRGFLEPCGIKLPHAGADALPELSDRYESNVPGLYVIGALAGFPLIKQAMNQGYDVVEYIRGNPIRPLDHELLVNQFRGLPFESEAEELLKLFMRRIPMFRQLNALAFRELIIESRVYASHADPLSAQEAKRDMEELRRRLNVACKPGSSVPRTTQIVSEGDVIYQENDYGVSFFTVVDGEVSLESASLPGGRRVLQKGDFFGEMSLIAGQPRLETARVGRNCVLVETPRRTILKLMASNEVVRQGIDWIFVVRELQRHFAPTSSVGELRPFADRVKQRTFRPGEALWNDGAPSDSVHILRNGTVAMYRRTPQGRTVVAELRAGEILGLMTLFGEETRPDSAIASVYTETIELSKDILAALVSRDPEQIESLRKRTASRLVSSALWETRPESGHLMDFLLANGMGEATNALVIDEYLCVACDNCEKACAETHCGVSRLDRAAGPTLAHLHLPTACRHCQQPHCMKDCPPNAIHRSSTGEVYIDNTCIGCGNCQANCPYGVIRMEYEAPPKPGLLAWLLLGAGPGPGEAEGFEPSAAAKAKGKRAVKCDACLGVAGGPACVTACPTGAARRISPAEFVRVLDRST
jgi:Fe-S-cluster-containing hydrogenase component 2/thioredoxin reductase/CRP-like cAMP-binding protein